MSNLSNHPYTQNVKNTVANGQLLSIEDPYISVSTLT